MASRIKWLRYPRGQIIFTKALNSQVTPSNYVFTSELRAVDLCLNFLGTCPPVSSVNSENGTHAFSVNYREVRTWACVISALISIVSWVDYAMDTVFELPIYGICHTGLLSEMRQSVESNTRLNEVVVDALIFVLEAIFCVVAAGELLEIIFGWGTSQLFTNFLNRWNDTSFGHSKSPYHTWLTWKHTAGIIYVAGPTLAGIGYRIVRETAAGNSFLAVFRYTYFVIRFVTVGLLMDMKQLIIFDSIKKAFGEIHSTIENAISEGIMDPSVINEWRTSIEAVREQCKHACNYQQFSQLLFVARCTAQLTLFVFVILNTPHGDTFSQMFSILWMAYCSHQILRLNVKIYLANMIPSMERKIAHSLATIKTSTLDQAIFNEVKFTYDLITQNPTRVVYGGFVAMETRLLAAILGQVITYLIVMMQFIQAK